jgi:hypothetical protein
MTVEVRDLWPNREHVALGSILMQLLLLARFACCIV